MKKLIILLAVILCFIIFLCSCKCINENNNNSSLVASTTTEFRNNGATVSVVGPCKVLYVIDGDTLMVNINNIETKVRLIGINTPESVSYDESRNNDYGKRASDFTKSIIEENDIVHLEYDEEKQDKYGRDLAYVYLEDGRMLNYILVQSGYAETMTIAPNTRYADSFKEAETHAQIYKIGFWAEAGEEIYK